MLDGNSKIHAIEFDGVEFFDSSSTEFGISRTLRIIQLTCIAGLFNTCLGSRATTLRAGSLAQCCVFTSPPIGRKVMSRVPIPNCWAANACPSSCRKTHPKIKITRTEVIAKANPVYWIGCFSFDRFFRRHFHLVP